MVWHDLSIRTACINNSECVFFHFKIFITFKMFLCVEWETSSILVVYWYQLMNDCNFCDERTVSFLICISVLVSIDEWWQFLWWKNSKFFNMHILYYVVFSRTSQAYICYCYESHRYIKYVLILLNMFCTVFLFFLNHFIFIP